MVIWNDRNPYAPVEIKKIVHRQGFPLLRTDLARISIALDKAPEIKCGFLAYTMRHIEHVDDDDWEEDWDEELVNDAGALVDEKTDIIAEQATDFVASGCGTAQAQRKRIRRNSSDVYIEDYWDSLLEKRREFSWRAELLQIYR